MLAAENREGRKARAVTLRRFARLSWLVAILAVLASIPVVEIGGLALWITGAVVVAGWTLGFVLNELARRAEAVVLGEQGRHTAP